MSGQSGGHRLRLSKLNEQLTCKLCNGYFIDATTIIECLHSFCRSCIVKYLEKNKYCPICEVQVHKSKPLLNIRPDYTLQDIVYKLVPGCYQNEMRCRREFYSKHPEVRSQAVSPEARGEPIESHIYSPDESLSLSLQYFNPHPKETNETNINKETVSKILSRRYLRCPAAVTVFHLQKLIRAKYGLHDAHRVDIMYKEEPLSGSYTLMDVMYIYHWRRKVPLHLSYRIFESSPKRIKLSEDNVNYKKSLLNAGIDCLESEDEHMLNREWKEVQLKISETGVMSITDISNSDSKRSTRVEDIREQVGLEGIITTVEATHKPEALLENSNSNKPVEEATHTTLGAETHVINNCNILSDLKKPSLTTASDLISATEKSSTAVCVPLPISQEKITESKPACDTQNNNITTEYHQEVGEAESIVKNNNNDSASTTQIENSVQSCKVSDTTEENTGPVTSIKLSDTETKHPLTNINNNINIENKAENHKHNIKNVNDAKTVNAGSKIDALSAKLQFQPKISQVNNTHSKRVPKEKRMCLHNTKKLDTKTTESVKSVDVKNLPDTNNTRSRTNCTAAVTKVTVSCNAPTSQQSSMSISTTQQAHSVSSTTSYVTSTISTSSKQETPDKNSPMHCNQNTVVTVQQALSLLDQRINSPDRASVQCTQKTSQATNTNTASQTINTNVTVLTTNANTTSQSMSLNPVSQKPQHSQNNNNCPSSEDSISHSPNVSTALVSQATLTFPYTVQDIVSNAILKSPPKNSNICSAQKFSCNTLGNTENVTIPCTVTGTSTCPAQQFSMQTPSMSIYSISTTLKSSYANANQNTNTTTTMARQGMSKPNFEITGIYSVPPCPDAIPISLMKPLVRKHEVIAKGTNLNEICAKIGTSGSKINDICAKIGENSKEKNKAEARNKMDIPDLLKIAKKSSVATPVSDPVVKHIPNIPNVPIYSPNSNATSMENKNTYTNVKDNIKSPLLTSTALSAPISHGPQKISSLKKQNQSAGYKTLRDPPKSWNPTLSKNNYVAVKNQVKEMQNSQNSASEGSSKSIPSKPAKIFKVRNVPRYLGNPASGVKPMYGVTSDTKEKEQTGTKSTSLNMMKIDPKTLSPIVSTSNSPIVSPPPYSPNARSYQNTPFSREMCRNTNSPISPRNSPVNMLSTNPFIPSPTPNTNPRLIYSHFPPPFPDASRFPNPLIRSPIGIPPPSAFHSSLPPSINKLYQRSSYIPQTTGYSSVTQPPTVQRIPPSTHSSSPKSPKTPSPNVISSSPFNLGKTETQTSISSSVENVALLFSKGVSQQDHNAFNLSKSSCLQNIPSNSSKSSGSDASELQNCKQSSSLPSISTTSITQTKQTITTSTTKTKVSQVTETPNVNEAAEQKNKEVDDQVDTTRTKKDNSPSPKAKITDSKRTPEKTDVRDQIEKQETVPKINGDVAEQFDNVNKLKEHCADNVKTIEESSEPTVKTSSLENVDIVNNISQGNVLTEKTNEVSQNESKNEDREKTNEQVQGKKSEVQRNKAES